MVFIPTLNACKIEVRQSLFGQNIENTLYFQHLGTIDTPDMEALGSYVEEWFTEQVMTGNLSVDLIYRETVVTELTTDSSPSLTINTAAGFTGTNITAGLPGNVAFSVSFRTNARGRSARGRNYVAGIPESVVTGNAVQPSFANSLVTGYKYLTVTPLAEWTWGVLSLQEDLQPREFGLMREITNVVYADLWIDSQRRRLTGRGT